MSNLLSNDLFLLFLVMGIGYAFGRITVKGLSLGTAGIMIVGLVFGHFGYEVPSLIQNIGLAVFVTSVGFLAGPTFFGNFKGRAKAYVLIGVCIILSSAAVCLLVILCTGTSADLSLGLLAGALTTTPGLAAGIESTGSDLVSVGYGIAYPFGVISVVIFVQALPRLLHVDMEAEKKALHAGIETKERKVRGKLFRIDPFGLFSFSVAILIGYLIGKIRIPLPAGFFSLGTSGGPLLAAIVLGYFHHIGPLDMRVEIDALVTFRELGLAAFLAGAGTHAGKGFLEILTQRGPILFVYGAFMAVVPLVVGFLVAYKLLKLNILEAMGSICGGMTSTPALGTLLSSTGTEDVSTPYAATYPIALALVVIVVELIGGLLG